MIEFATPVAQNSRVWSPKLPWSFLVFLKYKMYDTRIPVQSLKILAERTKFKIKEIIYDSNESQFWGSQQFIEDIPLLSENSYARNPEKSIFSRAEIKEYKKMAQELNSCSKGDQAAIYMVKE